MSLSFTLRMLCAFNLLALVSVFIGSVNCLPKSYKNPSTLTSGNNKRSGRDQKIIGQARSVQKPKGYGRILQKAKQLANTPEPFGEEFIPRKIQAVHGRGYTRNPLELWNYTMLVVIDKKYSKEHRDMLEAAVYTLKKAMKCFDFKIASDTLSPLVDHVFITPGKPNTTFCGSLVGRQQGLQRITLSPGCINLYGIGIHEIMHALGFNHEHSRVDRDEYVTVNYDRIRELDKSNRLARNFEIRNDSNAISEYDYESILHYQFSEVLTPKRDVPDGVVVGQRDHLSDLDLTRLLTAYPCKESGFNTVE